jgi:hypothetical protein
MCYGRPTGQCQARVQGFKVALAPQPQMGRASSACFTCAADVGGLDVPTQSSSVAVQTFRAASLLPIVSMLDQPRFFFADVDDLADDDLNVAVVLASMRLKRLPQPRSSRMPAADTRAADGLASWLTIPASTLMHRAVCPRAPVTANRLRFSF